MRFRYFFITCALLLCARTPIAAHGTDFETEWGTSAPFFAPLEMSDAVAYNVAPPVPRPSPLALKSKDATYLMAYRDTFNILSAPGACSNFFGGAVAREALNDLAVQLKPRRLGNRNVGMLMDGETRIVIMVSTGRAYRLFERAALNSNGPFFRGNELLHETRITGIGSFAPNTRGARVLILLHELAHLIRQTDGRWLIPNDGLDAEQSARNTALVEAACEAELKALGEN
ncbi:MAG TPA: hypothetical protein VF525_14180 [Pyrinomonadaceae bacterium]